MDIKLSVTFYLALLFLVCFELNNCVPAIPGFKEVPYQESNGNVKGTCGSELENCINTGGKCIPNIGDGFICQCPPHTNYDSSVGCQGTCGSKLENCINTGGICVSNKSGAGLICKCPLDTNYDSSVGCKVDEIFCSEEYPKCTRTGGKCTSKPKKGITCECWDSIQYEEGVGCKVPDGKCITEKFQCEETGGKCIFQSDKSLQCLCKQETNYVKDIGCKGVCTSDFGNCENTGGICISNENGDALTCKCPDKITYDSSVGCKGPDEKLCVHFPCYNRGICKGESGEAKCTCIKGYSGDHCEMFSRSECKKRNQICAETGGRCISVGEEDVVCYCPAGTSFVPSGGCKGSVLDVCNSVVCYNGGLCENSSGNAVCSCPDGFDGDRCEIYSKKECELKIEKCVETNGTCISEDETKVNCTCKTGYNFMENKGCQKIEDINCKEICGENSKVTCGGDKKTKEKVKCSCKDKDEIFDEVDKECKRTCKDNSDCRNEGLCKANGSLKTCSCPEGTEGPFCEIISSCKDISCGEEAKCIYNNISKLGECQCKEKQLTYDAEDGKCKRTCKNNSDCRHGGLCKANGSLKVCSCSDGTEGPFCEIVLSCKNLTCGEDAKCIYNNISKRGECQCKEEKLSYDKTDKKCKRTCKDNSDCQNGGLCEANGSLKTCSCLKGTEGPFCEIVLTCNDVVCGDVAKCMYNSTSKVGECRCTEEKLSYDMKDKKCKRTCKDTDDCQNGGLCKANGFLKTCLCPEGTGGSFCEIVQSCKNMTCGKDANCIYNNTSKVGECRCKEDNLSYDTKDKKCKRTCKDDSDCRNEGLCKANGTLKTCSCPEGTEGPFCEIVPSCKDVSCGKDAKCIFNNISKVGECHCKENKLTYDAEDEKCKRTCKDNSDCRHGGLCKANGSLKVCSCSDGTQGPFCEIVLSCKNLTCGEDAKCIYNNRSKRGECQCKEEKLSYDKTEKKCKRTCKDNNDCQNGGSCEANGSLKTCSCLKGTEGPFCEIVPNCNDMVCGDVAKCMYNSTSKVGECRCTEEKLSYDMKDKKCKRTCKDTDDCQNGGLCKANGSLKTCLCPEGTGGSFCEIVQSCKNMTCGKDANCIYNNTSKVGECRCKEDNLSYDTKDKKCKRTCKDDSDCRNEGLCKANGTLKTCSCPEGTEGLFCEIVPSCKDVSCGKDAKCIFNNISKVGECHCKENKSTYDAEDEKCKRTCKDNSDCRHGGLCKANGSLKVCSCSDGTQGPFCEIVLSCKNLTCGEDAKCIYNNRSKRGECQCKEEKLSYDKTDKKCKRTCKDNSDCQNGGLCEANGSLKTCSCLKGTEGPFCEIVPTCNDMVCGDVAKCMYNITSNVGECRCMEQKLSYDMKDKKCKHACSDDSDCENGGSCEENGSLKICSCREGTEGPFCEKVHSCKDLDCGNEAKCILEKETETPICRCSDIKLSFDKKDKKCKINKCKEHCGVEFGEKNNVRCHGDPFGDDISCNCTNKTMDFSLSTKICKVNKCKEKCGFHIGQNGKVLCSGDPYGDKEVSCSCKDNSLKFSESEKDCKYQEKAKLSFFATFFIALSVMIGFVLIMATIVYCRQKSKKPQYSMKFSNQTISFESALYDATNDSLSLFETRN